MLINPRRPDTTAQFAQNRNEFCAAARAEFCRITSKGALAINRMETKESLGVADD